MSQISIIIEEKYYTKDPLSSELGRRIVQESILLLDELGFEQFTFKKLAERLQSTEASIYRYFDNKLKLLIYLITWYWAWLEYMIDYDTHHLTEPTVKLNRIWEIICHVNVSTRTAVPLDIYTLRRIVVGESDKTYLTKQVDVINKEGLFRGFKTLCHRIAEIMLKVNPTYPFAHALTTTMLEAAHQQTFFARHLPSLTEISSNDAADIDKQVSIFISVSVQKLIS